MITHGTLIYFRTNWGSGAELNRHLIPSMVAHGRGRAHVGSVASEQAASVGYNSVKAALAAYVKVWGEWPPRELL